MIIVVEGKIGSGKTYWAVNYLVEKWYDYNPNIFQYQAKGNIRIITNIKGLELPHVDLDSEVERLGGLEKVFSEDYPGMKDQGVATIFIVDEAQGPRYFPRKYYNPQVFLFLQKSRHIGVDVILITQDKFTLSKEVQVLSEYNVQAIQRTVRAKNVFMYKYVIGDEVAKRKNIIFNKRVAGLYTSFEKLESEKVTYVWKKYAVGMSVAFVFVVIMFKLAVGSFFGSTDNKVFRGASGKPALAGASEAARDTVAQAPKSWREYEERKAGYKQPGAQPGASKGTQVASAVPAPAPGPGIGAVPEGGPGTGVKPGGEPEREPLVPMKCQEPDKDGWQECFEGARYVGRFKAWRVKSTLPEYGRRE